jgi:hypothetical protein
MQSKTKIVSAPLGGLNGLDSIADMPAKDAIILDNFWPTQAGLAVREGWGNFASVPTDNPPGSPHDIRALLSYTSPTGAKKLFATDQTGIYNITSGGAVAVADIVCTNGAFQSVNTSTAGGNFMLACNGVDKLMLYDGTNWVAMDGVSTPAITGITSTDCNYLHVFQQRVYIALKNSLNFAYLGVNAISGAASTYPLGAVFKRGGSILCIDSWTIDGGNGLDDMIVFITTEGEVAIYSGYDPSNAATWSLVGVYYIGKPVSKNCTAKIGGDLMILTTNGLYPLSKALSNALFDRAAAISYKIQNSLQNYIEVTSDNYGWQLLHYPSPGMLLINVPYKLDSASNYIYSYQLVMNTTSMKWARFTGMSAEAWVVHDGNLYFACHNKIYKAWTGNTDNNGNIIARAKQAFTTLGSNQNNKHVKMLRPVLTGSASANFSASLDTDFGSDSTWQYTYIGNTAPPLWDVATWDESVFAGSTTTMDWVTLSNMPGMYYSLNLKIETSSPGVIWVSTQYLYEICDAIL